MELVHYILFGGCLFVIGMTVSLIRVCMLANQELHDGVASHVRRVMFQGAAEPKSTEPIKSRRQMELRSGRRIDKRM